MPQNLNPLQITELFQIFCIAVFKSRCTKFTIRDLLVAQCQTNFKLDDIGCLVKQNSKKELFKNIISEFWFKN
jgi:hypothetical protein